MPIHFDLTLTLGMLIVGVGALLQSSTGFGFALFAAPLLALLDPHLVPGPILILTLFLTIGVLVRDWRHIDWPGLGWISAGRLPATLVAALMATVVPKTQLSVVFAVFVLCGVAVSLTGKRFRPNPAALVTAGGLAGFFGTLTSIGAPPLVLVYQHHPAPVIRSTLSANVVIGTVASIVALTVGGQIGSAELTRSIAFAPACIVGLMLSRYARPLLDGGYIRPLLLMVSAGAAIGVLVREMLR
jgi:uncharacterized membrane protein YfcA